MPLPVGGHNIENVAVISESIVAAGGAGFADVAADSRGQRILLFAGDDSSVPALRGGLASAGFHVTALPRCGDISGAVRQYNPHLVVLDWDVPDAPPLMDLVRRCRHAACDRAPRLIALSSHAAETHVVAALELGLDDFVAKPFSLRELIARVRAILRSVAAGAPDPDFLVFHRLQLDLSEARAFVDQGHLGLRAMEFRLLAFLMQHPERAFSRAALLERVWGAHCRAQERAVDVVVQRIRKSLAKHGCEGYLQTIRSVGYLMLKPGLVPEL